MTDYNVHILTKELTGLLVPMLYSGIKSIYEDAVLLSGKNKKILITFQKLLEDVPKWNQSIIDIEYSRIIKESECEWLEELITGVFLSNIEILTSFKLQKTTIPVKIPPGPEFIHKCYIETARQFWKRAYLFQHTITSCEYQRNMRDCESIIYECICDTIRKTLPIKHIVKDYVTEKSTQSGGELSIKLNPIPENIDSHISSHDVAAIIDSDTDIEDAPPARATLFKPVINDANNLFLQQPDTIENIKTPEPSAEVLVKPVINDIIQPQLGGADNIASSSREVLFKPVINDVNNLELEPQREIIIATEIEDNKHANNQNTDKQIIINVDKNVNEYVSTKLKPTPNYTHDDLSEDYELEQDPELDQDEEYQEDEEIEPLPSTQLPLTRENLDKTTRSILLKSVDSGTTDSHPLKQTIKNKLQNTQKSRNEKRIKNISLYTDANNVLSD